MIDIKTAGLSQDIKELKGSKTKSSGYYNQDSEKKKLGLMKSSYDVDYNSNPRTPKEYKDVAKSMIDTQREKLSKEDAIKRQEKKVYSHTARGKLSAGVNRMVDKFNSSLNQRVINRNVMRKSPQASVTIPKAPEEGIWQDENRFFKGNFEKEKRSMFLS
jgi:hypothetical protein